MGKLIVYRTDGGNFENGRILTPRGDHYETTLDNTLKEAEQLIRNGHPDGANIRSNCIYVWDSLDAAERAWPHEKGKHLYELEIDEKDTLHVGDLDHYSAVVKARESGQPTDDHVRDYWNRSCISPRLERLVSRATVLRKLKDKSAPRPLLYTQARMTDDELVRHIFEQFGTGVTAPKKSE